MRLRSAETAPRGGSRLGGWLRLFAMLGLTVLGALLLSRGDASDVTVRVLPWMGGAFLCYLAPVFVSKHTDLFSPPGLVGLQGALATAAMMAMISRDGDVVFAPLGFLPREERIDLARRAATLMIVAHCAYLAGYFRASGDLASRLFPAVGGRRWHGGRLLLAVVVTALVAVPFYLIFQQKAGGAVLDVTQLGRGKEIIKQDPTSTWMVRGIVFTFVPALLMACAAITDRSRLLMVGTLVTFGIAALLVTRLGPRGPAMMVGLVMLGLFHFLWRKIPISVVVGLLLSAVVVVNTLGDYRSTGRVRVGFVEGMSRPAASIAAHESDRNRLNVIGAILHHFPERQDYLLGESYTGLPLFWVPRWLWPNKRDAFVWRGNAIAKRLVGLPAPSPFYGVMYANFSWLGVVVGMSLFGAFHRGLARYRERNATDVGVTLLYMTIGVFFSPTFLGLSATIQYALPLTLLIYVVSRPRRSEPRPRPLVRATR